MFGHAKRKLSEDKPVSEEDFLSQRHPADLVQRTFSSPKHPIGKSAKTQPIAMSISKSTAFVDLTTPPPELLDPVEEARGSGFKDLLSEDANLAQMLHMEWNGDGAGASASYDNHTKKPRLDSTTEAVDMLDMDFFESKEQYSELLAAAYALESRKDEFRRLSNESQSDFQLAKQLQEELNAEVSAESSSNVANAYANATTTDGQSLVEAIPSEEQQLTEWNAIYEYGQGLLQTRCIKCRKPLIYNEDTLIRVRNQWLEKEKRISGSLQCNSCSNTHTCMGCHKSPGSGHQVQVHDLRVTWCCERGRLFIIWTLLCLSNPDKPTTRVTRRSLLSGYIKAPKTGNRASTHSGIGYGDNNNRGRGKKAQAIYSPVNVEKSDALFTSLYALLAEVLPSWNKHSNFDTAPPPILLAMIKRSTLLSKTAELLRNDSVDNLANRHALYDALLDFMRTICEHHITAPVAYGERLLYKQNLLEVSFCDNKKPVCSNSDDDKLQSLARVMQDLKIQAQTFTKHYQIVDSSDDEHAQMAQHLCHKILHLAEFIRANTMPSVASKSQNPSEPVRDGIEWHRENCVDDVADEGLLDHHAYADTAKNLSGTARKRMKKLMMEIAGMKTSLPEGIYVRHGSSRLDVLKVIIVGPKGSPYENGLFEFDVFCPANYPDDPPMVKFKTTGGGAAHFNPNLYRDGKVCLSLIGTWSGEPWRPGQSTLLQVFVSIQSMIFCEEPWCNEPGRESQIGSVQSKNFNKSIRRLTLRWAMLDWAEKQKKSENHIWTAIVDNHFQVNTEAILLLARNWLIDGFRGADSFDVIEDEFALDHHFAGHWPDLEGIPNPNLAYGPPPTNPPSSAGGPGKVSGFPPGFLPGSTGAASHAMHMHMLHSGSMASGPVSPYQSYQPHQQHQPQHHQAMSNISQPPPVEQKPGKLKSLIDSSAQQLQYLKSQYGPSFHSKQQPLPTIGIPVGLPPSYSVSPFWSQHAQMMPHQAVTQGGDPQHNPLLAHVFQSGPLAGPQALSPQQWSSMTQPSQPPVSLAPSKLIKKGKSSLGSLKANIGFQGGPVAQVKAESSTAIQSLSPTQYARAPPKSRTQLSDEKLIKDLEVALEPYQKPAPKEERVVVDLTMSDSDSGSSATIGNE
jgi:ubiquitin-protein ligase